MKILVSLLLILSSLLAQAKTSAEERAELDYELAGSFGADYKMNTLQAGFSKFLNQDHLVGLRVGSGSYDNDKQTSSALHYKYFTGSTFYISPEIFYLNYHDSYSSYYGSDDVLTTMGIHFRFGNQWQWEHFSLGVDWLGAGYGLVFFNRKGDFESEAPLTLTALNFYLAYSF